MHEWWEYQPFTIENSIKRSFHHIKEGEKSLNVILNQIAFEHKLFEGRHVYLMLWFTDKTELPPIAIKQIFIIYIES